MSEIKISSREWRVISMGGFVAVNPQYVHIDDLIVRAPVGSTRIARVRGNPSKHIIYFGGDNPGLGCIAGWISDEDEP